MWVLGGTHALMRYITEIESKLFCVIDLAAMLNGGADGFI